MMMMVVVVVVVVVVIASCELLLLLQRESSGKMMSICVRDLESVCWICEQLLAWGCIDDGQDHRVAWAKFGTADICTCYSVFARQTPSVLGLTVMIFASQAGERGSTPRVRINIFISFSISLLLST
ncbi:hypothetical protein DFP73DRAFT_8520 [Morchella snyderi]|nr:hypothetical protein DFP73DRAFT_8520 [Morchella snyderi]